MQFGPYAVDYEYRPYNPERMRNERIARAQASLKKNDLGSFDATTNSKGQFAADKFGNTTYNYTLQKDGYPTRYSTKYQIDPSKKKEIELYIQKSK